MQQQEQKKKGLFVVFFWFFFRDHEYMHEPYLFSEEDAFDGQQFDMIFKIIFLALCVFDEKKSSLRKSKDVVLFYG